MKKINLAISGCLGRMGQQLIKSSKYNKNFKLVALTENKTITKKIAGINIDLNTELSFKKTDVIVDFTVPKCTLDILKIASKLKKRLVIGTTGFSKKEEILINLDEGTIGLEFDWLAEAKLVLTDDLIKEMLKQRKINQNFDDKDFDTIETERLEEIE